MNNEENEYLKQIKILEQKKEKSLKSIEEYRVLRILGWIGVIIAFIIMPENFTIKIVFVVIVLFISSFPALERLNYAQLEEEINQKKYQYEHSPEKEGQKREQEREKKEKELQKKIDMITPFNSVEEKGDYYIMAVAWELSSNEENIKSVNVFLNSKTKHIKNLYFKYNGKGKTINPPLGATEENFLDIERSKIYNLRDAGKYEESENLFREVFGKDPFTGEDLVDNKD